MALFERCCGVLSPDLMLVISGTGGRWGEYHSGLDRMLAHVAHQQTSKACGVLDGSWMPVGVIVAFY